MTEIQDLLSYKLHRVANLLSRGAELRYRREFGVSLWEWRSIALLGAERVALSLNHLAHAAGVHKSQMSRVVSGLAKRGLVRRDVDAADARGLSLTLTPAGRRVYLGLMRAAADRDAAFRACLSAREHRLFDTVLTKLAGQARDFIHREKLRK